MDALVGVIALAVFAGTWWWLAKQFRKSGKGFLVRHLLGCAGAWMASLLEMGIAVSSRIIEPKPPQPAQEAPVAQATFGNQSDVPVPEPQYEQPGRPDVRYSIIKEEYRPGFPRKVEVMLSCRLTDTELASLAAEPKANFKGSPPRTFLGFRVEGQTSPTYWANARFDPEYSFNIIGLSLADYERLRAMDLSAYSELKGSWLRDGALGHLMVLYRKNGKYVIDSYFADGSKGFRFISRKRCRKMSCALSWRRKKKMPITSSRRTA